MFRPLISALALLAAVPAASFANTIEARGLISDVTIYPQGARVLRRVTIDAPAGDHEVIIPGLPAETIAEMLRILPVDGLRVGAVNLASGRLPVTTDQTAPEVDAAKAEVERLEQVLRDRDTAIAAIRLRASAAQDQIAFLQNLSQQSAQDSLSTVGLDDIRALARMVGEETLAARQVMLDAETAAQAAMLARADDAEALDKARQALAALTTPETHQSVLTLAITTSNDGPITFDITTYSPEAQWAPVYDMNLTTGDAPTLMVERRVVVSQYTGEDWSDVTLTLSTARPGERTDPSEVYSFPARIVSEEELAKQFAPRADTATAFGGTLMEAPAAVVVEESRKAMGVNFEGATLTYVYDGTVNIRNGVENLRLTLDTVDMDVDTWAAGSPQFDPSAYLVAEITNTTGEVFLPGPALLIADGSLIGYTDLSLIADGDDAKVGFGAIDGIRLTRTVPNRTEGDVGIISRSNQQSETAQIKVENLTGQDWTIHLRDAIPYSEQDDLVVAHSASLPVTTADPEGRRGVLEWVFDLSAGDTQDIRLDHTLTWPTGYVLQ